MTHRLRTAALDLRVSSLHSPGTNIIGCVDYKDETRYPRNNGIFPFAPVQTTYLFFNSGTII